MADNLLNPWAVDCNGNIISIEHAQKGQEYTCPKCGEPLSYCKSGTGPHARRDHFKHKADTDCVGYCTPHETESYIHKTAKEGICRILKTCLDNGQPFIFSWTCPTCGQQFKGNLLNRAATVKTENVVDTARSDVAILNGQGDEIVAIEVVYKHDVEQSTLALYEEKNITLIRLNFYTVEDLNELEHKLRNPDNVNICLNVKCNECQESHMPRLIIPLQNKDGKNAAVAVAVQNPFDEKQSFWGLPFIEQDKQNAIDFVHRNWPDVQIDLQPAEQSGLHLARFVASTQAPTQIQSTRRYIPYHVGIEEAIAKQQRRIKAIRYNYATKGTKKFGGKRRR